MQQFSSEQKRHHLGHPIFFKTLGNGNNLKQVTKQRWIQLFYFWYWLCFWVSLSIWINRRLWFLSELLVQQHATTGLACYSCQGLPSCGNPFQSQGVGMTTYNSSSAIYCTVRISIIFQLLKMFLFFRKVIITIWHSVATAPHVLRATILTICTLMIYTAARRIIATEYNILGQIFCSLR
jgi:hypothetical protein